MFTLAKSSGSVSQTTAFGNAEVDRRHWQGSGMPDRLFRTRPLSGEPRTAAGHPRPVQDLTKTTLPPVPFATRASRVCTAARLLPASSVNTPVGAAFWVVAWLCDSVKKTPGCLAWKMSVDVVVGP